MPDYIYPFLMGLLFGSAVSACTHFATVKIINEDRFSNPRAGKAWVGGVYVFRFFINAFVLFLVYKNIPVLIGTGIGLTMSKNALFIKHIILRKR